MDHACTLPLKLFWPEGDCPVTVVPVCINTVQFPLPSAKRCYALGKAVGQAIQSWDSNKKVAVIASGGLSHQLDGERAGFINKAFDLQFIESLTSNPEWATQFSVHELVEKTGTQGVELLMWLAMRGRAVHRQRGRAAGAQQLSHPHFEHGHGGDGPRNDVILVNFQVIFGCKRIIFIKRLQLLNQDRHTSAAIRLTPGWRQTIQNTVNSSSEFTVQTRHPGRRRQVRRLVRIKRCCAAQLGGRARHGLHRGHGHLPQLRAGWALHLAAQDSAHQLLPVRLPVLREPCHQQRAPRALHGR